MKKVRNVLAMLMSLIMCLSMYVPTYAVGENNQDGIVFDVVLDTPTISTSDADQTVIMRLTTNKEITVDGLAFTVRWDSPLKFTHVTGGNILGEYNSTATNYENGKTAWYSPDSENVTGETTVGIITFNIPANTPAGTYQVGVDSLELTKNYADIIWENQASAFTTLTITDNTVAEGYTAGVTALTNNVSVGEKVIVNVSVSHNADSVFAAGEMVFTYDAAKISFNQASSALGTATVNDAAGTLTLEDYGTDKNFGSNVYTLAFNSIADGAATVGISSAAFVNKENAVRSDLINATINPQNVVFTINKKAHTVVLPDIFTGSATVTDGNDYVFSVTDSENYDYDTVTATMNGNPVTVIDNGDGTYTIKNVTGDLVISGSRTEKSYEVTFTGNAAGDITDGSGAATYNTDYTFTMPVVDGWAYSLDSIIIGGTAYTGYSVENSVYRIPGTAIKGNIVISVSKSETTASVIVEGSGAGTAAGYDTTADLGADYTLSINPENGYSYTISATMNGAPVSVIDNGDNTYTIENVTGNIVFTVEKVVKVDGVSVAQYLTLDETVMWLVKNDMTLDAGKVATYAGQNMFWSEQYNSYCYLVVAPTLDVETVTGEIGISDGTAVNVNYGMDVNMTGKVDASDAQLTYNMYNAVYSEFTSEATVEKFLRADVNADEKVNVEDAAAIITGILS